ncbi:cholesterol 7-desaturase nvd-like [Tubulanus polymorphus]|uniref:cholesterol 7-desaturase nvd-like n=1 Tax=Tubulanus polymorphus TaxID=672921 RepID=UPI003DA598D5
MSSYRKKVFSGIFVFSLAALVSAAITERLFDVPLAEVGHFWLKTSASAGRRFLADWYTPNPIIFVASFVACLAFVYAWHYVFVKPTNRVKLLTDLGYRVDDYSQPQHVNRKDAANMARKMKLIGDVPPVYPNGWYGVLESMYVKKAQAKYVTVIGQNLAVFRGEDGRAHIIDAYCAHLGANLAIGGRVKGDCLECPFHGWQYRGDDGKCTKIPYAQGKVPEMAKVKSWPVMELNGWIYLWFHAEGAEPYWTPPEIPEITSGQYTYRGRTEHTINAHIEDIPENGADLAHLDAVHSPIIPAGSDLKSMYNSIWSFAKHEWHATWGQYSEPDKHVGALELTHTMRLFGIRIPILDVKVVAKQIGPSIVYLEFNSVLGKGVFVQSLNPVEPLVQKMIHLCYFDWKIPTFVAKIFLIGEALQIDRDIMIWNNKRYEGRPVFVKSVEDSQVQKHRRWYSQFYSENSPRLKFQKDTLEF